MRSWNAAKKSGESYLIETCYRLGLESARRNPSDAGAALLAAERTVIFKEAAVADLAGAREFFLAGHSDGLQENPKARSAFDRCVASVAAKGGAYDPRAVCASAGRKKLGQAEMTRRAVAGKGKAARGNPASVLVDGREIFTGSQQEAAALAARLKSEGIKVTTKAAAKGARHGWKKNAGYVVHPSGNQYAGLRQAQKAAAALSKERSGHASVGKMGGTSKLFAYDRGRPERRNPRILRKHTRYWNSKAAGGLPRIAA